MRGWYFGYIPWWVIDHFNRHDLYDGYFQYKGRQLVGRVEEHQERVKGKYYEYMVVVVNTGTRDNSIVKRKLRR